MAPQVHINILFGREILYCIDISYKSLIMFATKWRYVLQYLKSPFIWLSCKSVYTDIKKNDLTTISVDL